MLIEQQPSLDEKVILVREFPGYTEIATATFTPGENGKNDFSWEIERKQNLGKALKNKVTDEVWHKYVTNVIIPAAVVVCGYLTSEEISQAIIAGNNHYEIGGGVMAFGIGLGTILLRKCVTNGIKEINDKILEVEDEIEYKKQQDPFYFPELELD